MRWRKDSTKEEERKLRLGTTTTVEVAAKETVSTTMIITINEPFSLSPSKLD